MSRPFKLGVAAFVLLAAASAPARAGFITNGGFEDPSIAPNTSLNVNSVPGWNTDALNGILIRRDGLAFAGDQYAALYESNKSIYQDVTGIAAGTILDFTFAHRGNLGTDTVQLTITDLGLDNTFGTLDDMVLFTSPYSTDNTAWTVYTGQTSETLGNTIRVAFTSIAVFDAGENNRIGNFLDAVDLTAEGAPVPAPAAVVLVLTGLVPVGLAVAVRRRRTETA